MLVTAGLFAWAIWQPEASDRASDRALDLLGEGKVGAALAQTRNAADADPLASRPLLVRADIEARASDTHAALGTLERAVARYPGEPSILLRLGRFQLDVLNRPLDALESANGVLYLDPRSIPGKRLFADAKARAERRPAARRPSP